eukprot:1030295-Prorocentrum_minimum.AAC.1
MESTEGEVRMHGLVDGALHPIPQLGAAHGGVRAHLLHQHLRSVQQPPVVVRVRPRNTQHAIPA